MVISGSDVPEEALEQFMFLAGNKKAAIVVLRGEGERGSETSQRLLKRWDELGAQRIEIARDYPEAFVSQAVSAGVPASSE